MKKKLVNKKSKKWILKLLNLVYHTIDWSSQGGMYQLIDKSFVIVHMVSVFL